MKDMQPWCAEVNCTGCAKNSAPLLLQAGQKKTRGNVHEVGGRQTVRREGSGKDIYASWVADAFEA